jgi:hypothetical protein
MSGYLRRLGAQALGQVATLRPPAQSQPTAVNDRVEDTDSSISTPIPGPSSPADEIAPESAKHGLTAPATVRGPADADPSPALPAKAIVRAPRTGPTNESDIELENALAPKVPRDSPAQISPSDRVRPGPPRARNAMLGSRPETTLRIQPGQGEPPPSPLDKSDARSPAAIEPPRPPNRSSHNVRPAMPDARSLELQAGRSKSDPRADNAAAPAPDVHIHIGRVELTALMPPAAPRREPTATAKKPMSLDEYLRRRDGKLL